MADYDDLVEAGRTRYRDDLRSKPVSFASSCDPCGWAGPARSFMALALDDKAKHDLSAGHVVEEVQDELG